MSHLPELRSLMRRLRAPDGGCPWDREQTFATIVPHTLEEAYEVAAAIEDGRLAELPGELGDLLFQVIFYAELGRESGQFDFDDVVHAIENKLVRRHPHVFADSTTGNSATNTATVSAQWEALKARERAALRPVTASEFASELDDVPLALPALTRARKLQQRAARVGFDWHEPAAVVAKLDEEVDELKAALVDGTAAGIDDELGDLLFTAVNLVRHLGRDPETVLRAANRKFEQRFRHLEAALQARGETVSATDDAELDRLWEAAKAALREA